MGILSAYISRQVSPEAVRPFWSEVAIYALGLAGGWAACIALDQVAIPFMLYPFQVAALLASPFLVRIIVRKQVRRLAGLPWNPGPWRIRANVIRFNPDHARSILPSWQLADDSFYLPGMGHYMAGMFSIIMTIAICMASHGILDILYPLRWGLAIMLPAVVLGNLFSAFFLYRLAPPGTPDRSIF